MIGVILAAGDGTRLKKNIDSVYCKALTKIADAYLIEFSLNNLLALGIDNAMIVVGKSGDKIKEAIGTTYKGLTVTYVHQQQQKGLINAFIQALSRIEADDVVLQLADEILIGFKSKTILKMLKADHFDFYCGYTNESDEEKIKGNYSIETDDCSIIKHCIEKPSMVVNQNKGTRFCIFCHTTLHMLKEAYNELQNEPSDLCDFINFLISNNIQGKAFCVADCEFNINTANDLNEAVCFFQNF